ncbi:MAG TPA: hypothetical protein VJT31_01450 [Rugosimonospora sp.]|nr:hypothetical protein [Rugosimonospora sp.]
MAGPASVAPSTSPQAGTGALGGADGGGGLGHASPAPASPTATRPTTRTSPSPARLTLVPATGTKATTPAPSPGPHCPHPGQRVKTGTSPKVYLVDPGSYLNWIPDPTAYENLWGTAGGITTVADQVLIDCFGFYFTMGGVHLAKTSSDPKVYIYDASGGGYRWIVNPTVFDKYAFVSGKIKIQASISPISPLQWAG